MKHSLDLFLTAFCFITSLTAEPTHQIRKSSSLLQIRLFTDKNQPQHSPQLRLLSQAKLSRPPWGNYPLAWIWAPKLSLALPTLQSRGLVARLSRQVREIWRIRHSSAALGQLSPSSLRGIYLLILLQVLRLVFSKQSIEFLAQITIHKLVIRGDWRFSGIVSGYAIGIVTGEVSSKTENTSFLGLYNFTQSANVCPAYDS